MQSGFVHLDVVRWNFLVLHLRRLWFRRRWHSEVGLKPEQQLEAYVPAVSGTAVAAAHRYANHNARGDNPIALVVAHRELLSEKERTPVEELVEGSGSDGCVVGMWRYSVRPL